MIAMKVTNGDNALRLGGTHRNCARQQGGSKDENGPDPRPHRQYPPGETATKGHPLRDFVKQLR